MKIIILIITVIFFLCGPVFSQSDSVYNCMIGKFRLYQNEKGKNNYYEFDNKWNLVSVNDSFFIADPNKFSYKVNINDITRISYRYGPNILKIAGISAFSGFALGFLVFGLDIRMEGGIHGFSIWKGLFGGAISACVVGSIGALIGILSSRDDRYDINGKDINTKRKELLKSLYKNKYKK